MTAVLAGCEDRDDPSELNQSVSATPLTIRPAKVELTPDETVAIFTSSGGTPPYRWRVSDASLGSVPLSTANTITYTPTANTLGANVLQVVDQNNWVGQATIYQIAGTNSTP